MGELISVANSTGQSGPEALACLPQGPPNIACSRDIFTAQSSPDAAQISAAKLRLLMSATVLRLHICKGSEKTQLL